MLWTSAGMTLDNRLKPTDVQDFYSLGGFFNLSGLAPQSLLGPNYAIARAIYFRKIGRGGEGFFEFPAYIGASFELGNTWARRSDISFGSAHKDGSIFIAFDTFLGPVYLGSGYDQTGQRRLLSVPGPHFLKAAALGELLDLLEHQRGLIADARIFVLAGHLFEHAVALGCGEVPVRFLPIAAEQLGKRIPAAQAHPDAVGLRQHRYAAHHVLSVRDSHAAKR